MTTDGGSLEAKIIAYKGERMAVVSLCGAIGRPFGFQASQLIDLLRRLGHYTLLYAILDSSGGSAVEAWIIYDFLIRGPAREHESLVLIAGECSSDAILIALAFRQILMRPESRIRFQPIKLSPPAAARRLTGVIARVIANRVGCQVEDVLGWMDKNRKITAEGCLELSLCDAIV